MWSYTLPKIIDPNNQNVKLSISFDTTFFSFNQVEKVIKQVKSLQSPLEKTILITLESESGLTSSY